MTTTLADETVLRMALAMFAADATSPCTDLQRRWLVQRLQGAGAWRPFTGAERRMLQAPLLAWYRQAHPRTAPLVARQFEEGGP